MGGQADFVQRSKEKKKYHFGLMSQTNLLRSFGHIFANSLCLVRNLPVIVIKKPKKVRCFFPRFLSKINEWK